MDFYCITAPVLLLMPLMYSSETDNNNNSYSNSNDGNVKIKNRCYKHNLQSYSQYSVCLATYWVVPRYSVFMYCILVTVKSQFSE